MPIIKSAKKQLKQNKRNKSRNDHFRALYREARKDFEKAVKEGDAKAWLQAIVDKLVKKNIIHKNNASRKKANFVKMMKALS